MGPFPAEIFACFRFNPTTNGAGPNVSVLRSKPVVDMHMSTASAFFRLTRSCPERVMTHFDGIGTEVTNLWADPNCGMVEKCVLLEALILLCLRLPQSIEVQRDLLKQLSTPMLRLLTSCATGGSGLVSILGLDQPISAHQDFQSPYVQMRITFGQNVLALLATSRRLSEPANSQQLQQITVPLLEPVVSSVFTVVRSCNSPVYSWLSKRILVHCTGPFNSARHRSRCPTTGFALESSNPNENGPVSVKESILYLDNYVDSEFSEEEL
ncbi:hypothetical protein AHF37_04669 [Paragonimus kellicotti]|nr:hypothetical protein AHF37_04669 [Paragonimus kellicotti]